MKCEVEPKRLFVAMAKKVTSIAGAGMAFGEADVDILLF